MSKEIYEITKERILKAIKECPDWTFHRGLKALFPKAFEEEDRYFDLGKRLDLAPLIRTVGEYNGKAYILPQHAKWEIKYDKAAVLCIIPTRKDT